MVALDLAHSCRVVEMLDFVDIRLVLVLVISGLAHILQVQVEARHMDCGEPGALVDLIMKGVWETRNRLVQALRMGLLEDGLAEAEMAVLVERKRVVSSTANDLRVGTIELWAALGNMGVDVIAVETQTQAKRMGLVWVHCSELRV